MKQLALFSLDAQLPVLPELDGCSYVRLVSIDPEQNRFRFYTRPEALQGGKPSPATVLAGYAKFPYV